MEISQMTIKSNYIKKILFLLSFSMGIFLFTSTQAESIECEQIKTLPAVITVQGKYCFKGNLSTNITSGHAIDIQTNNVTIDFNDYKLGGLAGGIASAANGVHALDRKNIILRNGSIRGFRNGVYINELLNDGSSGHIIENTRFDGNLQTAIWVEGRHSIIRNNIITNTGGGTVVGLTFTSAILASGAGAKIDNNLIENTFDDNKDAYGILIEFADSSIVTNNKISNTFNITIFIF